MGIMDEIEAFRSENSERDIVVETQKSQNSM
eukprot:CAMPEP_0194179146 /NCGR_PEP_ID=MMETSP0154-20130528/12652_1 /TAXON_ID=1049557 /ORGANISM="Thalassiothrix antarctica, Strain L6-D1" /LENGTH=30 /DNA_ID= /DNA_START= /DNA_END= /DNA_ORIENTATION=